MAALKNKKAFFSWRFVLLIIIAAALLMRRSNFFNTWKKAESVPVNLALPGENFPLRQKGIPIQVWFNDPPSSCGGLPFVVEELLQTAVKSTQPTVVGQLYQLNIETVVTALLEFAKQAGAENLKLFFEDDYITQQQGGSDGGENYYQVYKRLKSAGIELRTDVFHGSGHGQSHNKFLVINNRYVWTGSWNMTRNETYRNFNHGILFDSLELAQIYKEEFNLLWGFGTQTMKYEFEGAGVKKIMLGNTELQVYFSPQDFPKEGIIKSLQKANQSIYVAMFRLTDMDLLSLLAKQKERGIDVRLMLDGTAMGAMVSGGSARKLRDVLREMKIPYQVDQSRGFLHHKFAVIDAGSNSEPTVITGSYNWTRAAAEKNDENLLVIKDEKLALRFQREFLRLYGPVEPSQQLLSDYNYPLRFTGLKRQADDLLLSVSPGKGFYQQILRHNGDEIKSFTDNGEDFIYELSGFFKRRRSGSFTIEMPGFGIVEALPYAGSTLGESERREWLKLAVGDYWRECPPRRGLISLNCGLDLFVDNLCLQRSNDWLRKAAWVSCQ